MSWSIKGGHSLAFLVARPMQEADFFLQSFGRHAMTAYGVSKNAVSCVLLKPQGSPGDLCLYLCTLAHLTMGLAMTNGV